jgi:hypothetical protein
MPSTYAEQGIPRRAKILMIGAAIGVLVTAAHYEQAAHRRWAYEKEIAEGREIYAALAMYRRIRPAHPSDDEES